MKKIEKNCLIEGILKDLCTKHDVLYQKFGSAYMLCKWCEVDGHHFVNVSELYLTGEDEKQLKTEIKSEIKRMEKLLALNIKQTKDA